MKKHLLLMSISLSLIGQLFFACQNRKDAPAPSAASQPGYFVLTATGKSTTPNAKQAPEKVESKFDLGPLNASKEFLFMLANGGDESIFDITLTSDNQTFEISPKTIQLLPGKGGSGIIPMLSVGIIHGRRLNGIGEVPNLPKGENKAIIRMTGKTISKKDTVEVTGEFIVTVEAKVIDAKILSGDRDVTYEIDDLGYTYSVVNPSKSVKIVNTGNVPWRASILYYSEHYPHRHTKTSYDIELQPDEIKDITDLVSPPDNTSSLSNDDYVNGKASYYGRAYISIYNEGVVVNVNYFKLESK